jgi:hypothetical protein
MISSRTLQALLSISSLALALGLPAPGWSAAPECAARLHGTQEITYRFSGDDLRLRVDFAFNRVTIRQLVFPDYPIWGNGPVTHFLDGDGAGIDLGTGRQSCQDDQPGHCPYAHQKLRELREKMVISADVLHDHQEALACLDEFLEEFRKSCQK